MTFSHKTSETLLGIETFYILALAIACSHKTSETLLGIETPAVASELGKDAATKPLKPF